MIWIFPYIRKKMLQYYRKLLRWMFWGISQQLKQIKSKIFAISA